MDREELSLVELIDVETLQRIQNAFSSLTGMASLTTEKDGTPVTRTSNITNLCSYIRSSQLGRMLCQKCDKFGAQQTMENGIAYSYLCHAGLVEFAAPIMANGAMVGCFIGGQVLTSSPNLREFGQVADQLGLNRKDYIKFAKKVRIVSKEDVDNAAQSLSIIAETLSGMAYNAYKLHISNVELEKAARAKSDFLANMSHEIRTPMNAVLGMTEMALREDMSPSIREYLHQIRSSGKNLLVIINDILDFSKIESGKMEILPVTYEPLSMINDISSIISSRIGGKDIQLIMDISPDIPAKLYGDNVRIQQILINLLNNAVKFTKRGMVKLHMYCEDIDRDYLMLRADIIDTGSGIKEEDIGKLFKSFQQVDSKRNRNIEGTGLGLAITQRLLELMNGAITVSSEYNKGSTFSFKLPQKKAAPLTEIPKPAEKLSVALLTENRFVREQLEKDLDRVVAEHFSFDKESDKPFGFLIAERKLFTNELKKRFAEDGSAKCIIIDDFHGDNDKGLRAQGFHVIRKPVYYANLYVALGIIEEFKREEADSSDDFSFIAPDAEILIVDDNSVNLTVARGLLAPLKMNVDTALSAAEAIEAIKQKSYDVIFMDHMMPEVDGIEATHIIRSTFPAYAEVPIIALTANAVGGVKDMFLQEGLNDFVAKPVDTKIIVSKLRKWLPQEKIIPVSEDTAAAPASDLGNVITIEGLDVEKAMPLLGSANLYMTVLKEYFLTIDKKSSLVEQYRSEGTYDKYTIEVHSIKSTSRQIGAFELGRLAEELEHAGNSGNIAMIEERTDAMLEMYRSYKHILEPYFPDCAGGKVKKEADAAEIMATLDELQTAISEFDMLTIDEIIEKLSEYKLDNVSCGYFEDIRDAAESGDIDLCEKAAQDWKNDITNMYINR